MSIKANPSAPSVAAILAGAVRPAPASSAASAPAVRGETVGQHYVGEVDTMVNSGLSAVGTGLHFTAEAVPGVLLAEMASIKAAHQYQAYQQIYRLPWDAQGKWKVKAYQIMAAQSAQADAEINKLPMVRAAVATGQAVVEGANAVGTAVVNGATYVGNTVAEGADTVAEGAEAVGHAVVQGTVSAYSATVNGVQAAGQAVANAGQAVSTAAVHTYKAAGRGFLGWIAYIGQSLFSWASGAKTAFAN